MAEEKILTLVDQQQQWLDPLADQVQKAVSSAYESAGEAGQQVKNFMHGTWLGDPLHPTLTDIPIGSWTAAFVMDACEEITGSRNLQRGADAAVAVGLAGAAAAAVTGITDWNDTHRRARRIGLLHGILNLAAAGLYAASMVARRNDNRSAGRGLAYLGYGISMGSAYLGGKLVYREQMGVDHTATQQFPADFTPVLAESELPEGQMKRVEVNGARVLLVRDRGELCAIAEVCSHLGGPLAEGELKDGCVTCPWHKSTFDVHTGEVVNGPAVHPQPKLDVQVRDGQIEVKAQAGLGPEDRG